MHLILLVLAIATFLATLAGGMFALKLKDKYHLILGFSAGAVIGVAFFDLLPEALNTAGPGMATAITTIVAAGFAFYLVLDRMLGLHPHSKKEEGPENPVHEHSGRGVLRASSLSIHSFLDGLGIGLAFQVSAAVGAIVAVAVLAHDFSDGINTVTAIIKGGGTRKKALRWLLVDAGAPVLGIIATLPFTVAETTLSRILAIFCGFFLYIGASDLVPESYHAHPTKWTTIMTVLGAGVIYLVIQLAG